MKKLFLLFAATVALSLVSCNNTGTTSGSAVSGNSAVSVENPQDSNATISDTLKQDLEKAGKEIKEGAEAGVDAAQKAGEKAAEAGKDAAEKVGDKAKDAIDKGAEKAKEGVDKLTNK